MIESIWSAHVESPTDVYRFFKQVLRNPIETSIKHIESNVIAQPAFIDQKGF